VRLIRLEGAKTGDVAAVRIVEETDEELLLISAAGQVVRTDVKTVSRQLAGARGVIVMRLNDGDEVAGIAVFRAGLAEQRGIEQNGEDGPGADGPGGDGTPS
jgi:DNA gyrase/topoisomerase IV subunit A